MNPLTQIKNTQKITKVEIELGLTDKASWHDRFRHSAYVFVGGLPFELTEGDILAVFAQFGEPVDVHLVRDRKTGAAGADVPPPPCTCLCCPHGFCQLLW
jgi:RNA-binding motif X-linked protein 2